ncbi:ATP-binding cassette domain-containing protein [Rhodobacteraceae bacterium D3-12]|nr:ATP-binding cassette domain-containing protein [Rhodobacteraceae bacterium D3-12]
MSTVLEARDLVRIYETRRGLLGRSSNVRAVDGVSLEVRRGETLGVVGESGSGKSSLGRMLLGIDASQGGAVYINGEAMPAFGSAGWRSLRARIQMIYQDPLAALDRRINVAEQLREPLDIHRIGDFESRMARVREVMQAVGLRLDQADKFPHELSGGQRQRVVIARALMTEPELLVCDEPVSALDVSIQAQVVNLLADLQRDRGLGMVFISHDLKVVRNLCDRVAVMYLGRIVEEGPADTIFSDPQHPYTQALVSSVPQPGRALNSRIILQGEPPNPGNRPSGCAFHPRCHKAEDICRHTVPETRTTSDECRAACHFTGHVVQAELV